MFILLIIHKQNRFIDLSYQKQKKEKEKEELSTRKKLFTNQLYTHANHAHIKTYALHNSMESISLSQIKKLTPLTKSVEMA
jgi:hypothetical protein